ncbi:MAG: LeuA family protein [Thermodesulfobacteriota bacterium]
MAIIDSTLREGCQAVGVSFSLAERLALVDDLVAIGIEEIELGVASHRNPELVELVAAIRARHSRRVRLALWSRCREEDIGWAAKLDLDVLSLSIPVTDRLLKSKMGCAPPKALSVAGKAVRLARRTFPYVSLGLEDATRAEPEFLDAVVDAAVRAGASRVRLADTVGIGSPGLVSRLVTRVRLRSGLAVGFHGHNDFGMATANAVSALEAGAAWVDVTVLGLGERAGNARLEELVAWLGLRQGMGKYDLSPLRPLCQRMARLTGRQVSRHHPVIGEEIFACETGLHLLGLLDDPDNYEPFPPQLMAHERRLYFGAKSGLAAVERALRNAGVLLPKSALEQVVRNLREYAKTGGTPLAAAELPGFALGVTKSSFQGAASLLR